MSSYSHRTKEATIENVKRLFSTTTADIISLDEAYAAWGRDLTKTVENKAWISNLLTHLKFNNLVKPIYSHKTGRRTLDKIQLTMEGKKSIGRIESDQETGTASNSEEQHVTMADAMKIVAKLRKENPDYDITFDVKLKENL